MIANERMMIRPETGRMNPLGGLAARVEEVFSRVRTTPAKLVRAVAAGLSANYQPIAGLVIDPADAQIAIVVYHQKSDSSKYGC